MNSKRILLVEDEKHLAKAVAYNLEKQGFSVETISNGKEALQHACDETYDLIILDIMLPILNGFEACSLLRKDDVTKDIPIIFLSAKNTVNDITQGLSLGADDYLAKPFDYKELIARIKVRLRERALRQSEPKTITHGELKLILDTREARFSEKSIDLTQTEFDILLLLIKKIGQVVPRDEIITEVWREAADLAQKRTIDVHIRALRKKIPELTRNITSVYGVGYKYER